MRETRLSSSKIFAMMIGEIAVPVIARSLLGMFISIIMLFIKTHLEDHMSKKRIERIHWVLETHNFKSYSFHMVNNLKIIAFVNFHSYN